MANRVDYLSSSKEIIYKLLELSKKCINESSKSRFIVLSINFITLLTENFTIDLTEEIIVYTQVLDIITEDGFNSTVNLLKKVSNKLKNLTYVK